LHREGPTRVLRGNDDCIDLLVASKEPLRAHAIDLDPSRDTDCQGRTTLELIRYRDLDRDVIGPIEGTGRDDVPDPLQVWARQERGLAAPQRLEGNIEFIGVDQGLKKLAGVCAVSTRSENRP